MMDYKTEKKLKNEDANIVLDIDKKSLFRKIFRMLGVIGITSIVLVVATYAWFVGTTTVNIDEFEVNVEALDGLQISFDGSTFGVSDSIDDDTYDDKGQANNHWTTIGLDPRSSTGGFSSDGHLIIYHTASLSAATSGYRISADKVFNSTSDSANTGVNANEIEKDGYIVFDMFLKNTTNTFGSLPASSYTPGEMEAVYLSTDSSVELGSVNSDIDGLQNSIRIGFFQVAYGPLTSSSSDLAALNCSSTAGSGVAVLCSDSAAASQGILWNIWEPNDLAHVTRAITRFSNFCTTRTAANTYTSTPCTAIANGTYASTFAVNNVIGSAANVNIYDGLNTYTATTGSSSYLYDVPTFRSSTNTVSADYTSTRDPIFYLAPNSITKIRVYIWLEGQDVDNFDYDGSSRTLNIEFGFTKDRYELLS